MHDTKNVLGFRHIITTNDAKIVKESLPNHKLTVKDRQAIDGDAYLEVEGVIRYTLILALKVFVGEPQA